MNVHSHADKNGQQRVRLSGDKKEKIFDIIKKDKMKMLLLVVHT